MKYLEQSVSALIFALGLSISMATFAYTSTPEEIIAEDAPDPDMSEVRPVTVGEVTYLTGGIGKAESSAMRSNARNYALEIILVEKADGREEYISEVKIQLQDSNKNTVLDTVAEGPYLLANLPQGKYFVSAEYKGEVKTQWVTISKKKHSKVVFWWKAKPPSAPEPEQTQTGSQPLEPLAAPTTAEPTPPETEPMQREPMQAEPPLDVQTP